MAAEVSNFFDDVPQPPRRAHLVISRSGASTIAELAAAGRPAILHSLSRTRRTITRPPMPALSSRGRRRAGCIPQRAFTAENLAERRHVLVRCSHKPWRARPCRSREAFGRIDAAARLADLAESAIRGNGMAKEAAA